MAKLELISKSSFAKMMGVSPAAVTKAIKEGRMTVVTEAGKEKIDPAVAQIQWAQNTRARMPANGAPVVDSFAASASPSQAGGESGYWQSRASREQAEAAMAQLKLAEMQGSLIRVDAVKAAFGSSFAAARESLQQIPSRIAANLAAESDSQKIQIALGDAIHASLESLASAAKTLPTMSTSEISAP